MACFCFKGFKVALVSAKLLVLVERDHTKNVYGFCGVLHQLVWSIKNNTIHWMVLFFMVHLQGFEPGTH